MVKLFRKPSPTPAFQRFVADVSVQLLGAASSDTGIAIQDVLRAMGERYNVDRVVLRWLNEEGTLARLQASWMSGPDLTVEDDILQDVPWLDARTRDGEPVCIDNLDDFPPEAAADRRLLESQGLQALYVAPLTIKDDIVGALALSVRDEYHWTRTIRDEIASLAPIVANAHWGASAALELRQSDARYRAMVENQTEFIVRWLPDGTRTWVNDHYCEFFQQPRESLIGTSFLPLVAQEDREKVVSKVKAMTPENPAQTADHRVLLPSGETGWQQWTDKGIFDDSGNLTEIQSVGRDVTDRKLAEAALIESESKYRDIVESTTDLIWESDANLKIIYSNRRFEDILGYPAGALASTEIDDLMQSEDLVQLRADLPNLIATGGGWQRRLMRFRHKNGSYRYLESSATPVIGDGGEVCGFRGVDRDVTGEYFAAAEIRSKDAVYQLLMDSISDAVFTLDDDNTIRNANAAALEMFGATAVMIEGKTPWHTDLSPEYQPDGQSSRNKGTAMLEQVRAGQPVRFDWMHETVAGESRYMEISLTRIQLRDQIKVFAIVRDVTELRRARQRLERSAEFQRHKADLLIRLTSLEKEDSDYVINQCLARIGDLYGADRIAVWLYFEKDRKYEVMNRWLAEGATPPAVPEAVTATDWGWATQRLQAGETIVIPDVAEIPAEAGQFRQVLEQTNCNSLLVFPLIVEGETLGACSIGARQAHTWDDLAINELDVLTNTLAIAISRFRASEALYYRALFQTRLATISSNLVGASPEETAPLIEDTLATIGTDYGIDRINLTWFGDEMHGPAIPFVWAVDEGAIQAITPAETPWGFDRVLRGEVVRIDAIGDLPAEAHVDKATLENRGYRSVLGIPLFLADQVCGGAAFLRRAQREWDEETLKELTLIVNVLTSGAARHWSEAELSQREQDLARSQEVAGVGSFRGAVAVNEDGSVDFKSISMTDQALRIFGLDRGSESMAALMERIHPDDMQRVANVWQESIKTRSPYQVKYRIVQPDGSIRHIESRGAIDSVDSDGTITGFGTYKDISEWVEANQKLQSAISEIEKLKDQLQEENLYLRDEVRAAHGFDTILGESRQLKNVLTAAEKVAPTDVTVLVTGETGTGKELVARSIHELSHRKDKPMVCVNCAALSAELIESELFGHEKGAFTGAHAQRKGRFEVANGGTLFLDEIGEMSGDLQAKLLRVIQEGEFERLGGSKTLRTDVRLIAATNRDLQCEVDDGAFRADLFYRINSFPIHMPPLRERKEDIPLLAEYLVRKHAAKMGKVIESISARTLRFLRSRSWPGNVRELEGTIVRALITTTGSVLDYTDGRPDAALQASIGAVPAASSLLEAQRTHILEVLDETNWVIEGKNGAAVALGLAPSSLRSKMKRLNILRPS